MLSSFLSTQWIRVKFTIFTVLNVSVHNFNTKAFFISTTWYTDCCLLHAYSCFSPLLPHALSPFYNWQLTLTFAYTPPHLFPPSLNSPTPILTGDKSTEIPYMHILNNVLPDDIRVLAWAPVGPDFSARFSCLHRTYKYFFARGNMNIDVSLW